MNNPEKDFNQFKFFKTPTNASKTGQHLYGFEIQILNFR